MLVSYVFGPRLPEPRALHHHRQGAQGRSSRRQGEYACYVVEVCPGCSWNHLARTFILNPARSA